jgi:hypothetical protein
MWIILSIIGLLIATYLLLFLGWHIPNHLTEKGKPPYYMVVLSILYAVIGFMALWDLIQRRNTLNVYYLIFEGGSIMLSVVYTYAMRTRYEGGTVGVWARILYALGFGAFIFGIMYAITYHLTVSIINGIFSGLLCLLPIPKWLDKYLTPPSKESTAWYAVLHKFRYPRKED